MCRTTLSSVFPSLFRRRVGTRVCVCSRGTSAFPLGPRVLVPPDAKARAIDSFNGNKNTTNFWRERTTTRSRVGEGVLAVAAAMVSQEEAG